MEEYYLVIIGGGFAGYSAAVYAARYNLKTLVITSLRGGLITTTHLVENYPGYVSLSGQELADKLEEHVRANNVPIKDDLVDSIEKKDKYFYLKTQISGDEFKAKSIMIGTGTKHRHLNCPGEKEFANKGVSYCATCDGMFFKNKDVIVVGGSDSAAKEAMVLAQNANKVTMLIRSKLRAEPINSDRVRANPKIEYIEGVQVKEIKGDKLVESVILDNEEEIKAAGVFIAIGMLPQSELAKNLGCKLNKIGEIEIDRLSKTSVDGVFAAGDVTNSEWKQGIIGAAEGSAAAYSAFEYINNNF